MDPRKQHKCQVEKRNVDPPVTVTTTKVGATTPTTVTRVVTTRAVTTGVAMQSTGAPLALLALSILALFGGLLPRRK